MVSTQAVGAALEARTRRQKRSQVVGLVLMGVTPLVVLGIDPLHSEVRVFSGVVDCQHHLPNAAAYCTELDSEAASRHLSMAPRYSTREQCEADFAHVAASHDCRKGWCAAASLSVCERTEDNQFRPAYNGFLVEQPTLDDARRGSRPSAASLSEQELQPAYGMSQDVLHGGYYPYSYIPFHSHFVTANAQYLAPRGHRESLTLRRSQLAPGAAHAGPIQRGGFGATARQTMQAAAS